ncbi:MARVEL domain-containing protein 3 [Brachyhypopomus gauderio]|uniref:MARVEL domain-containing protein 3 n=1 Tax=Brachyhypopomus gauderio TaxID=698409 RepID=UPI0040411683
MPAEHHQTRHQNGGRNNAEGRGGAHREKPSRTHTHPKPGDYEDSSLHQRQDVYTDTYTSKNTNGEALYNLRYITTSRGICQGLEVFLNLLLIICAGVPYSNTGRYRDIANMGGLYYYYYGGAQAFTAQEAAQVQELDDRFYQLKIPPYIFTMAAGGALMAYALAVLALGVFRLPFRYPLLLPVEAVLDALIGLGYIPAVAFYFIKLLDIYNNQICKDRAAMYNTKGLKGYECGLSGTDVAGGLFGVLGAVLFCCSAVLAVKAFRTVRKRKQPRQADENL